MSISPNFLSSLFCFIVRYILKDTAIRSATTATVIIMSVMLQFVFYNVQRFAFLIFPNSFQCSKDWKESYFKDLLHVLAVAADDDLDFILIESNGIIVFRFLFAFQGFLFIAFQTTFNLFHILRRR